MERYGLPAVGQRSGLLRGIGNCLVAIGYSQPHLEWDLEDRLVPAGERLAGVDRLELGEQESLTSGFDPEQARHPGVESIGECDLQGKGTRGQLLCGLDRYEAPEAGFPLEWDLPPLAAEDDSIDRLDLGVESEPIGRFNDLQLDPDRSGVFGSIGIQFQVDELEGWPDQPFETEFIPFRGRDHRDYHDEKNGGNRQPQEIFFQAIHFLSSRDRARPVPGRWSGGRTNELRGIWDSRLSTIFLKICQ